MHSERCFVSSLLTLQITAVTMGSNSSRQNDQLQREQIIVIEYWYRMLIGNSSVSMIDISKIIIAYADVFEILTFSKEFMSRNAYKLKYDNQMAIKTVEGNNWVISNTEPVSKGKVCWRINVECL